VVARRLESRFVLITFPAPGGWPILIKSPTQRVVCVYVLKYREFIWPLTSFQIIRPITGPVLTVTIFAVIIAYLHDKDPRINLTNNVVPLLSVVVGLILVFRYVLAGRPKRFRSNDSYRNG
jgi:hypothetical protein